jgi:hypothetical protein
MAAGDVEAQHASGRRQITFWQHLGTDAISLDSFLESVQIGIVLYFVSHVIQTRLLGRRQNDRVFIPLVPTLEINVAVLVFHSRFQTEHIFVMLARCRGVHDAHADMTYS